MTAARVRTGGQRGAIFGWPGHCCRGGSAGEGSQFHPFFRKAKARNARLPAWFGRLGRGSGRDREAGSTSRGSGWARRKVASAACSAAAEQYITNKSWLMCLMRIHELATDWKEVAAARIMRGGGRRGGRQAAAVPAPARHPSSLPACTLHRLLHVNIGIGREEGANPMSSHHLLGHVG